MTSGLRNDQQFCFSLNQFYNRQSIAYVTTGGTTYYIPQGGYVNLSASIPSTLTGTQQCCMADGCLGNLTCRTPTGNVSCICLAARAWSATVNACSASSVICN